MANPSGGDYGKCQGCGVHPALHPLPYADAFEEQEDGKVVKVTVPKPAHLLEKYPPQWCSQCWNDGTALKTLATAISAEMKQIVLPPLRNGVCWWIDRPAESLYWRKRLVEEARAAPSVDVPLPAPPKPERAAPKRPKTEKATTSSMSSMGEEALDLFFEDMT